MNVFKKLINDRLSKSNEKIMQLDLLSYISYIFREEFVEHAIELAELESGIIDSYVFSDKVQEEIAILTEQYSLLMVEKSIASISKHMSIIVKVRSEYDSLLYVMELRR